MLECWGIVYVCVVRGRLNVERMQSRVCANKAWSELSRVFARACAPCWLIFFVSLFNYIREFHWLGLPTSSSSSTSATAGRVHYPVPIKCALMHSNKLESAIQKQEMVESARGKATTTTTLYIGEANDDDGNALLTHWRKRTVAAYLHVKSGVGKRIVNAHESFHSDQSSEPSSSTPRFRFSSPLATFPVLASSLYAPR